MFRTNLYFLRSSLDFLDFSPLICKIKMKLSCLTALQNGCMKGKDNLHDFRAYHTSLLLCR